MTHLAETDSNENSSLTVSEPTKRKATIVVDYWWCGSQSCTKLHKTKETSARCLMRRRKPRKDFSERNARLWRMVVEDRMRQTDAARALGIKSGTVAGIIDCMARRRGIELYPVPDNIRPIEWIRQEALRLSQVGATKN